jgi:hypothetical protein
VHVDVFERGGKLELALLDFRADFGERLLDLSALVVGDQALLGEHLGMGDASTNIVLEEPPIEADALGELLDTAVGRLAENAAPRFIGRLVGHVFF